MEKKQQILVVDDDPEALAILQTLLEHSGYAVTAVYNGADALKHIYESLPDLIILDIMMPGMDGYEVCEAVKSNPVTQKIPVIMLTAKDMGDDVEKALSKKADWFVTKPYDNKYIVQKVHAFLKIKELNR
jgi:CheY-like chemotaxis protein